MKRIMLAAAVIVWTVPAQAATYVGSRPVGVGNVSLSITTDGTLGTLTTSSITGWTVSIADPQGSNVLTAANSFAFVSGTALTATATDLIFDFGSTASLFGILTPQDPNNAGARNYWCVQTQSACLGAGLNDEALDANAGFGFAISPRSGNFVIASTVPGAVPEPASWAMMVVGFGAVGGAMRARRRKVSYA